MFFECRFPITSHARWLILFYDKPNQNDTNISIVKHFVLMVAGHLPLEDFAAAWRPGKNVVLHFAYFFIINSYYRYVMYSGQYKPIKMFICSHITHSQVLNWLGLLMFFILTDCSTIKIMSDLPIVSRRCDAFGRGVGGTVKVPGDVMSPCSWIISNF